MATTCKGEIRCGECGAGFGQHRKRDADFSAVKIQLLDLLEAAFNLHEIASQLQLPKDLTNFLLDLKLEADAAEFMLLEIAKEAAEREDDRES